MPESIFASARSFSSRPGTRSVAGNGPADKRVATAKRAARPFREGPIRLATWLAAAALLLPAPVLAATSPLEHTLRDLEHVRSAIERYHRSTGQLPANPSELGTVVQLHARGIPMHGAAPADGWGRPYVFARRGSASEPAYTLYSMGSNGADDAGRGDDVVSRALLDRSVYPELLEQERGALGVFPLLLVAAVSPIAWAVLRTARRSFT